MDEAVVYLVPLGRGRYELYSEPPDETANDTPAGGGGFVRSRMDRLRAGWRATVQRARNAGPEHGWTARLRDAAVRRVADTVAEQRTLWSLRSLTVCNFQFPSDMTESVAENLRRKILARARRYHGIWLLVDGVLFAISGLLVILPGPNVLAYYFGLRVAGHFLSWRGARRGLDGITWRPQPEPALAELAALTTVSRESRASRVEAIAIRLKSPRLAAFFDRAALSG